MFHRSTFPYHVRTGRRQGRRGGGKPDYERNIPAAFFSLIVAGMFSVAMAEPNWLRVEGGRCNGRHIGLYKIFGSSSKWKESLKVDFCMTSSVVLKLRFVAAMCLLGVIFSMFQFTLDTCGINKRGLWTIRRNSIGNIISVLLAVFSMALVYWVTVDVETAEYTIKNPVKVKLDVAFYLTVGAGIAATIATTLNLSQCTCEERNREDRDEMALQLMYNELPADSDLPPIPPPVYHP